VPFGEIDLIPLEIDSLGHARTVASHDQDQCGVTLPTAALPSGLDELNELALAEVLWPIAPCIAAPVV
jgi:hypothetical protein